MCFPVNFLEFLRTAFLYRTPLVAASALKIFFRHIVFTLHMDAMIQRCEGWSDDHLYCFKNHANIAPTFHGIH